MTLMPTHFRSEPAPSDLPRRPLRGKKRPWRVLLWAPAALSLTLVHHDAWAAAFDVNDTSWEGCSELLEVARSTLGSADVLAVGVLDWSLVNPEDGVLALYPLRVLDSESSAAFMKEGGRLAIVDDYGHGEEVLRRFRIDRIPAPTRPALALRNRPALAIAEPVIDTVAGHSVGPHPVVTDVQRLVLNHPTGLRHPNLSPVMKIRAIGEPDVIVAVAGQVGKGRLFAMSDPSALTNQMLRYPGNRAFVKGLAKYLVDDDGQVHRRGRLWIVANRFGEEGSFGGQPTVGKEIGDRMKALASALEDARQSGFPGWVLMIMAAFWTLVVALWVNRSFARTYKNPTPRYARVRPLVAQGGVAGRFAVLSAPTSPPVLSLLELKSALVESVVARFDLEAEPSLEHLQGILAKEAKISGSLSASLSEVIGTMQKAEASFLAGRSVAITPGTLGRATDVVREVLLSCGADIGHLPGHSPPHKVSQSAASSVSSPGGAGSLA